MTPRILVIDDERAVRELLRDVLEPAGYEVLEAPNGRVGILLHKARRADLVVMDMLMPEKDGIETILDLREEFPNLKILAMSGGGALGSLQPLLDARRFGAVRTIRKPFHTEGILTAVRDILDGEE